MSSFDTSAINGLPQLPQAESVDRGFGSLSSDEFTKIIFAELSQQDPLEPNDTSALLEQISMIRSIESDIDLTEGLDDLLNRSEFASSTGLIGQFVGGINDRGERVADLVLSVSKTEEGPMLNLANGSRVSLAQVDEIVSPDVAGRLLGDQP